MPRSSKRWAICLTSSASCSGTTRGASFVPTLRALSLPGVEKIELANNEFGVKYRVLREQPEQKFLLFKDGPEPEYLANWLLDVQLASGSTFRTDQVALWLAELELGPDTYPCWSRIWPSSRPRSAAKAQGAAGAQRQRQHLAQEDAGRLRGQRQPSNRCHAGILAGGAGQRR